MRTMREIAAGLRLASDQCHEAAASLRSKGPEAAKIAPDVEALGFSLAMYATVADSIANAEGERPLAPTSFGLHELLGVEAAELVGDIAG